MKRLALLFVLLAPLSAFGQTIALVDGGNAAGCAASMNGTSVGLNVNNNGISFDSSGANLIAVVAAYNASTTPTVRISRTVGGVTANDSWAETFSTPPNSGGVVNQVFWTHPNLVGPMTTFLLDSLQGATITPSICVYALSGWNQQMPPFQGSNAAGSTNAIALQNPLNTGSLANVFMLSSVTLNASVGIGGPTNYIGPIDAQFSSMAYHLSSAWKFSSGATENPGWTFSANVPNIATTAVAFEGGAVVQMPALSFTTQPVSTVPGGMMTVVVHSSPAITTGNATLQVTAPPCGITLVGNSAPFNSTGDATFNLTTNGTGTGCTLTASAMGATNSPPSNAFQVTTAPILTWNQQPGDTVSGALMSPFIITTSPAAADNIGILWNSGNCAIAGGSTTSVTATGGGVATFMNVTIVATAAPPQPCTIKAFNNTHPTITIISNTFTINAPSGTGVLALVGGGNSAGCAASANGTSVTLSVNNNQVPFDSTGANLLVVAAAANISTNPTLRMTRQVGGTTAQETWTPAFPSPPDSNGVIGQVFYTHPTLTGTNTAFTLDSVQGATIKPSICAYALEGWNQLAPFPQGLNAASNTNAIALPTALATNSAPNVFILSSVTIDNSAAVSAPQLYVGPIDAQFSANSHHLSSAWKFGSAATENTQWTFVPNVPNLALTTIVFHPGNAVPSTLSFTTPPANAQAGMVMTPFVVTATGGISGAVTITPNGCGATFQPNQATISGTTATFSNVIPSGSGTGCTLTATVGGISSVPSAPFDVAPQPPGLVFLSQPTDTLSGQNIAQFQIQLTQARMFISRSGNVTLTPMGCGATFDNLVQALDVNGTATFNMIGTTGLGTGCYFAASFPGAATINSAPFNVVSSFPVSRILVPTRMRPH